MTGYAPVANKRRTIHNAIVLDTSNVPSFPSGPDSDGRVVFAGDFTGAKVLGMEWLVTGTFDLTTLDGKLQHSDDGSTWHDVDATNAVFTQLSAVGDEYVEMPADTTLKRYLRFALTAGSSGTTTNVELRIYYQQCGAKGALAPPGFKAKND